ncbi:phosphonoacetaldehyde hydrolase [Serratia rhizosphaerae]|uniref:phosphonoacetaldehyde hydrolase n=1 Tax=Serratia rhizosphaerae TaxID=2597702 RepID=UPI002DB71412|nr:phosphonoacetaldehyde hydrolase [Serratia rhizosphaerae]MEB6338153.1 phosphonoacetaldehyde hydrolase [Serratia rhizosphaerae]
MQQVNAVILDWAGTTVDFGSFAPTQIFVEAFQQTFGIAITLEEARIPMGLGKWQHIEALGKLPGIDARWRAKLGRSMTPQDIDALYQAFMPLQIAKVVDFAEPIAGVPEVIAELRRQGIKIGSCSGYPRAVMDVLAPAAAARGYAPDYWVATDDLPAGGRPGPWMALQNVIALGVDAVGHCVKVDDAVPGIAEGLNAGMWSVGLALSGNEFGVQWQEYQRMDTAEVARRRGLAAEKLYAAGAHYVIDTLAELPGVLAAIDRRLANGERP